jgi:hypothetical protein
MQLHNLETRFANLEHRLALLESGGEAPKPSTRLILAVRQTIAVLREFRDGKGQEILEDDNNDDYRDVISTLPLLEGALAEWEKRPI